MVRIPNTEPRESEQRVADRRQGFTTTVGAPDDPVSGDGDWDALALEPATIDGHHLRHVYRMSALGGDLAQLVAGALDVAQGPMPAWLQPYLDEGTAAEPIILARFYAEFGKRPCNYQEFATLKKHGVIAGYNPEQQQIQVRLEVGSSAVVQGHTDSIVCVNPGNKKADLEYAVVEAKKLRPTLFREWMGNMAIASKKGDTETTHPFFGDATLVRYGWQVAALFWSTMLPVYFVVGQWDVEKAEVINLDVLMVTERNVPYTLAQVKARVMKAEGLVKKGVVPQCEMLDDACVYGAEDFCLGKPAKEWEDVDDVNLGKLLGLHYAYGIDMQKTQDQKDAEKARSNVKDQIDKYMAEKGYARGKLMHVWDEAGNEFEYEWVQTNVDSKSYTTSYPKVKVIGELAHEAPEDDA